MNFDPAPVKTRLHPEPRRRWRPVLIGATAAAGLALFLGGTSFLGGSTPEVSAQEVFQRTHAIAASNSLAASAQPFHMVSKTETYGPPGMEFAGADNVTETWYQDAKHQRTETRDEDGKLLFGQVQNGDDLWFYSSVAGPQMAVANDPEPDALEPGEVKAVHSSFAGMGFSTFGPADLGVNSLAGLLEAYSGSCASAQSVGEETVAGRSAYVIEVTQTPETCDLKPVITQDGNLTTIKVDAGSGTGVGAVAGVMVGSASVKDGEPGNAAQDVQFQVVETTTRMWVDKETFITLKTETQAEDGPLFRYEVIQLDLSPDFDASVFDYEPPEGVEVVEASSPEDIKLVLSGGVAGTVSGGGIEPAEPIEADSSGR
jgi:hypothetical protein